MSIGWFQTLFGAGGVSQLAVWSKTICHYSFENNILNSFPDPINMGDASNNLTFVTGKVGNAGSFTGSNSYFTVPDHKSLSFTASSGVDKKFSISMWLKPTNLSATRWIVNKRSATGFEYQVSIDITTGRIQFLLFNGGSGSSYISMYANAGISSGIWTHVTCTYDASKTAAGLKIYYNGVIQATTNNSFGTYTTGQVNTTAKLVVGIRGDNLAGTNGFVGLIDELTIFNDELVQSEIDSLYNSGAGVAFSYSFDSLSTYQINAFVLANRGDYVFAFDTPLGTTRLWWSSDRGNTWSGGVVWGAMFSGGLPIHDKWINFAHIFSDGTVIFSTAKTMYRSTDGLAVITNPSIKGRGYNWSGLDSDAFVFHTPVNPGRPGTYFQQGSNAQQTYESIGAQEVLMWTNYGSVSNYDLGAAPTFIWGTNDNGATIQAIYCFGQNTVARDDGSAGGGVTGTLLGDAANPLIVRHGHLTVRRPGTNDWYVCTGDFTGQIHWLKVTYNVTTGLLDSVTNLITNDSSTNRWFGVGFNFVSAELLRWSTDIGLVGNESQKGIWEIDPDDIASQTGETRVKDFGDKVLYGMLIQNSKAYVVGEGGDLDSGYAVVTDSGAGTITYVTVTSKVRADILWRLAPLDSKGFMKMNLGGIYGTTETSLIGTIFVKP